MSVTRVLSALLVFCAITSSFAKEKCTTAHIGDLQGNPVHLNPIPLNADHYKVQTKAVEACRMLGMNWRPAGVTLVGCSNKPYSPPDINLDNIFWADVEAYGPTVLKETVFCERLLTL